MSRNILILGGSYFAGSALVDRLLQEKKGQVHTFNRNNIPLNLSEVNEIYGDRTDPFSVRHDLPYRTWDVVIDLCAYKPEDVEMVLELMNGTIGQYIFVSTISVYDHSAMLPLDGPQPNLGEYAFYAFDKIQTEKKLAQISGKKIRIVRMSVATIEKQGIPLPFSIDQHQIYSGTRLYRKFGFQSTPLVQGMEKTYGFYKSNLKKRSYKMDVLKKSRKFLIKSILEMELNMFQRVNGGPSAPCQEQPDAFKKIRGSIYSFWSLDMLESYYGDLIMAQRNNRNLVYEKYARMDNRIPPINKSPLIGKIVEIEQKWQEELKSAYPVVYRHTCRDRSVVKDGSDFKVYLASELETFGNKTLEKYYDHVKKAIDKGKNLSMEMLRRLAENSGVESLEKLEAVMQKQVNP